MLTIDKVSNNQTFYTTLKELSTGSNPTYSMVLFSYATNVTYHFDIITTTYSNDRYDRIEINLDDELESKVLTVGQYKYEIYQYSTLIEHGMLTVVDTSDSEQQGYIYNEPDETDDDYIVYSG